MTYCHLSCEVHRSIACQGHWVLRLSANQMRSFGMAIGTPSDCCAFVLNFLYLDTPKQKFLAMPSE